MKIVILSALALISGATATYAQDVTHSFRLPGRINVDKSGLINVVDESGYKLECDVRISLNPSQMAWGGATEQPLEYTIAYDDKKCKGTLIITSTSSGYPKRNIIRNTIEIKLPEFDAKATSSEDSILAGVKKQNFWDLVENHNSQHK